VRLVLGELEAAGEERDEDGAAAHTEEAAGQAGEEPGEPGREAIAAGRSCGRCARLSAAAQLVYRSSLYLRRQPPSTGSKMWQ